MFRYLHVLVRAFVNRSQKLTPSYYSYYSCYLDMCTTNVFSTLSIFAQIKVFCRKKSISHLFFNIF